jgi:hypothetical protein
LDADDDAYNASSDSGFWRDEKGAQEVVDDRFVDAKSGTYEEFKSARDASGAKGGVWKKENPEG